MKISRAVVVLLVCMASACAAWPKEKTETVLLVARRSGAVEVVNPATLQTLGTIRTGTMTDWVAARSDGETLLIARATPAEPRGCCALYSLDLETRETRFLIYPAQSGAISPDGLTLFTQRGNCGINTIDLPTGTPGPLIGPPGKMYLLAPAPNQRWLFGVANWQTASLDIFDLKTNTLARSLEVPGDVRLTGAWLRDTFYLLGYANGAGKLWSVTPETRELGPGMKVNLGGLGKDCRVAGGKATEPLMLQPPAAAGERLLVYEGFGMKLDRRGCTTPPTGGVYVVDPASGEVVAHLAASLYFLQIVANCEGSELYGIALGPKLGRGPVQLVRMDSRTGKILASREIGKEGEGWDAMHVSLAVLGESLVPRGEVRAVEEAPPARPTCAVTKPALDEPPRVPEASPLGFGEWYISEKRTIWVGRQEWRAGSENKVVWIRPKGARFEISARRLDGPAPPQQAIFREGDPFGLLVTGTMFPRAGCWEVTAKAGGDELRFVTEVAPARRATSTQTGR